MSSSISCQAYLTAVLPTQHPWQDHPLHGGRCGALPVLPVLFCGDNVLGGEQQQEQKGQVGCCVADELDERLADEEAIAAFRRDEVAEGEHGVEEADEDAGDEFSRPVTPPPTWELVVPPGGQELLAVWLSDKLKQVTEERK